MAPIAFSVTTTGAAISELMRALWIVSECILVGSLSRSLMHNAERSCSTCSITARGIRKDSVAGAGSRTVKCRCDISAILTDEKNRGALGGNRVKDHLDQTSLQLFQVAYGG